MPDFDPTAFGLRLTDEMARTGLDVKQLQERVRRRSGAARGTSYGSVWSYVNGQAPLEPRREVVEALAAEFGVLPAYLLHGGPRTRHDRAAAMQAAVLEDPFNELLQKVGRVLAKGFPGAEASAKSQLWRLWAAVTNRDAIRAGSTVQPNWQVDTELADPIACAEKVVRAVAAPLDELGLLRDRATVGTPPLDSYIIGACGLLWTAIALEDPRLSRERAEFSQTDDAPNPIDGEDTDA